jgi:probable HAF family extracellular repeat protein
MCSPRSIPPTYSIPLPGGSTIAARSSGTPAAAASWTPAVASPRSIFPAPTVHFAYGINNSGQIVGDYLVGSRYRGFLYTGGSFTTIPDIPGGFTVGAQGINDSGQIVGGYEGSSSRRSFLYTGGSFTRINVPGATEAPIANGINDSGQIVGTYSDFVCSVGKVPLACSGGEHGFLDTGGSFTTIDFPGAESTFAVGINDSGQIVGHYYDGRFFHSFLYSAGSFTTIDIPGPFSTDAWGINHSGQIVGGYQDSHGRRHGFLATPSVVPEPGTLPLLAACLIGLGAMARCRKRA